MSKNQLRVLCLGWGVQSFCLACMAANGDIEPYDLAVHADTGQERSATYKLANDWTPWLAERGLRVETGNARKSEPALIRGGAGGAWSYIPAYSRAEDGKIGQYKRRCTETWKIDPNRRLVRTEIKNRGWHLGQTNVDMHMGISLDEFTRIRESRIAYITLCFPLIDLKMTRKDCVTYLSTRGLPVPEKSSCTFCPFQKTSAWARLARKGGKDWENAVAYDEQLRADYVPQGKERLQYVFREAIPLVAFGERVRPSSEQTSWLDDDDDATCDSGFCFT
jgi:hypothetical protein